MGRHVPADAIGCLGVHLADAGAWRGVPVLVAAEASGRAMIENARRSSGDVPPTLTARGLPDVAA